MTSRFFYRQLRDGGDEGVEIQVGNPEGVNVGPEILQAWINECNGRNDTSMSHYDHITVGVPFLEFLFRELGFKEIPRRVGMFE